MARPCVYDTRVCVCVVSQAGLKLGLVDALAPPDQLLAAAKARVRTPVYVRT
jgi:hypothetical protein